jgi:hypothetical protein
MVTAAETQSVGPAAGEAGRQRAQPDHTLRLRLSDLHPERFALKDCEALAPKGLGWSSHSSTTTSGSWSRNHAGAAADGRRSNRDREEGP